MTINLTKTNLLNIKKFIELLKPLSIGCGVLAIAGLALYPLISNKSSEKVEDKVEEKSTTLPPAPYTIIMGDNKDEVTIKFHNQASLLQLKNINNSEYNCLLNGGGVNCVLATAYQPQTQPIEDTSKSTPQPEVKRQTFKIPDIEISSDISDALIVAFGVVLGLYIINKFKRN